MNDLRRRRDARDIWISRNHLVAGLALMVVASGTSFVLGFLLGRDEAIEQEVAATPIRLPDDALIELLARVEASALSDGGLEALTFPDALRGAPGGAPETPIHKPTATGPGENDGQPHVRLSGPAGAPRAARPTGPDADGPPSGKFTVVVATSRSLGEMRELERTLARLSIESWVGADIVEGKTRYKVAVGGFATAEEAARVVPVIQAAGFSGTVQALDRP